MAEPIETPPWWVLLPGSGPIAVRDIPISGERIERISGPAARTGLDRFEGVVLGKARPRDLSFLRSNGFAWTLGLAALPRSSAPRWYLCPGKRKISAAGLQMYRPQRGYAKALKQAAIHLDLAALAAKGIPGFSNQILIGLRQSPDLIRVCEGWACGKIAGFNLSTGTPGPFRTSTVQMIGDGGAPCLYLKVTATARARVRIRNEARVLARLNMLPACFGHVPVLKFAGRFNGCCLLAQSALSGGNGPASPDRTVAGFLQKLVGPDRASLFGLGLMDDLYRRVMSDPELAGLGDALARIPSALEVPVTVMHGDFAPWNLLVRRGHLRVTDWETGRLHGLPLFDLYHYVLRYGFLVKRWSAARAMTALRALARSGLFRGYLHETKLTADAARTLLTLHIIICLADEEVRRAPALFRRYQALLEAVGQTPTLFPPLPLPSAFFQPGRPVGGGR